MCRLQALSIEIESVTQKHALIDALRDPGFYPHGPEEVREIQTHISWVFLVPPFVYKVKKPLDLGFLDFRTLEARRHFCEEEVRLNRRLCPDIYLGVVPISRRNGRFVLGDGSDVTEYAVQMRELSGGRFARDLIREGMLNEADLDRVIAKLATFYRHEVSTPDIAVWGRIDHLKISTDENFEQTEHYAGDLLGRPAFEAIRFYTERFYDQHALLLNRRRAEGRILDCHGDLHLEHIYLTEESTCIYDCIEFSARLRHIDVANDTAFLAMDLDFHDAHDLARYFIERISAELDDVELPRVVDFYKCYRAYVRAKVNSMQSSGEEIDEADRRASRRLAERYYQLALHYAVAGSAPLVLVVMGRVGTGKSTVAEQLARALGWDHISSDVIRKSLAGADPYRRGDERERAELYAQESTERTYRSLIEAAIARCRESRGCVLDATFSRKSHRDSLRDALRSEDIPYCFIELTARDETIRQRLSERNGKKVVSDARLEDFEYLSAKYEGPDDLEDAFHVRISSEQPIEETVEQTLKDLIRMDLGA